MFNHACIHSYVHLVCLFFVHPSIHSQLFHHYSHPLKHFNNLVFQQDASLTEQLQQWLLVLALGVADLALSGAAKHTQHSTQQLLNTQHAQHTQHAAGSDSLHTTGTESWADEGTLKSVEHAARVGVCVCLVLGMHQVCVCVWIVCVCGLCVLCF